MTKLYTSFELTGRTVHLGWTDYTLADREPDHLLREWQVTVYDATSAGSFPYVETFCRVATDPEGEFDNFAEITWEQELILLQQVTTYHEREKMRRFAIYIGDNFVSETTDRDQLGHVMHDLAIDVRSIEVLVLTMNQQTPKQYSKRNTQ